MVLSNQDKKLLNEIFSESLKSPNGLKAARFRADNEQFISELNELERLGYVRRSNDLYSITLMAFAYLAKENLDARSIVQNCGLIFALLQGNYRDNLGEKITVPDIAQKTGLSVDDVRSALKIIIQTPILGSHTSNLAEESAYVTPSENVLKYKSFEDILKEQEEWDKQRDNQKRELEKLIQPSTEYLVQPEDLLPATSIKTTWKDIEDEFGVTKTAFGKRINFVTDSFKRLIIFRDVEQAFVLASSGFSKPAVILAGGVIEELLRLYLEFKGIKPSKKDFDGYIQTCEKEELLKVGISRLSDSVRYFRNLVHLSKEETKRHTISKSTAKGAVASIFTIVNDFEVVSQQLDSLRTKTKDSIVINGKKLKIIRFDPSQGLNLDNLQAVLDLHFHDKLKVQKVALQDLLDELLDNEVSIEEIEDGYHELLDIFPQVEAELSECMKPHRPNQVEVVRFILDLTHDAYWSYHETLMPSDLAEIIRKWRAILSQKEHKSP